MNEELERENILKTKDSIDKEELNTLSENESSGVRNAVADNENTSVETLDRLANDENEEVFSCFSILLDGCRVW